MKKAKLFLILTSICTLGYSTQKTTICNGKYSNNSVWKNGTLPTAYDTIVINHHIVLDYYMVLHNNVLIIDKYAEFYIAGEFTITSGSKIINYGLLIASKFYIYGSLYNYGLTKADALYNDYFKLSDCSPVIIKLKNDSLKSNIEAFVYQWYRNGIELPYQSQNIKTDETGYYKCRHKKVAGDSFSSFSDSIYVKIEVIIEEPNDDGFDTIPEQISSVNRRTNANIEFYPNPISDILHININDFSKDIILIDIYDLRGTLVSKIQLESQSNIIDLSYLNTGIYFLKTESVNNNPIVIKVLKK